MSARKALVRKPYEAPRLVRYGRIEKITMASGTGGGVPEFAGSWFGINPDQS